MANATKTNTNTSANTDANEATDNKALIQSLIQTRTLMAAQGADTKALDTLIEATVGPMRTDAISDLTEALTAHMHKLDLIQRFGERTAYMAGLEYAVKLTFDGEGKLAYTFGELITPKKAKSGTRTKAVSKAAGNVLVVDGAAFKSYAVLCTQKGLPIDGNSAVRVYEAHTKKDPAKYPAPALVAYETFYADPKTHAPKGYYESKVGKPTPADKVTA